MFNLDNQQAKIAHVNLREEKHGDDDVLACDVKIEAKLSNDFLSQLSPTLKWSLYDRDEEDMVSGQDKNHMPVLRYPLLGPLKWDNGIVGGLFTIHAPVSKNDQEFFADVNNLTLSPQDGGTVLVSFRAQFRPDAKQVSNLAQLLGKQVEISVAPPAEEPVQEAA